MKRNLLFIFSTLFLLLALILLGNMLVIGERVSLLHPALGWFFYLLIILLVIHFLIYPVYRVLRAPATPALDTKQLPTDKEELLKYGKLLACNNGHIADKKGRKQHKEELLREIKSCEVPELQRAISREIDHRLEQMDGRIRENALSVLVLTALSQNGRFDSLTVLIINVRMIGQLVRMSGFRPSWTQLCRIYLEVVLASFITDLSEDFLEEIDFSALLSSFKIPVIFVKSVIDGSLSALMTLRIGYITRLYLVRGTDAQTVTDRLLRRSIRHQAIKQSVAAYPSVLMEGMGKIKSTTGRAFGNWFKGFGFGSFFGGKSE